MRKNMRSKVIRHLTAMIAILALTVAACGDGGGNGGETTTTQGQAAETTVIAKEFFFEPANIEVPAGVPVTIVLVNEGVIEHDLTIDEVDLEMLVQPGETLRETMTYAAGTYVVYCSIPGHREAGMEGTLVAG
jgi:uncharacterized cupredoxin-like copper-binding protein